MSFHLEIETDNAAFYSVDDVGSNAAPETEVARILRAVAKVVEGRGFVDPSGHIRDANGNRCGQWSFEADEPTTAARLEELRDAIRAENMSYGELAELQGLAEHIDPGDVELLQWAGVPEYPSTELEPDDIPEDFEVRPITEPVEGGDCPDCGVYVQANAAICDGCGAGRPVLATCGTCGLTWDDAAVTSWTPVPSGRCPFEYFHVDEEVAR